MKNLERIRKELSPERRKKIADTAEELLAEEMTLRDRRKAHELTQQRLTERQSSSDGSYRGTPGSFSHRRS